MDAVTLRCTPVGSAGSATVTVDSIPVRGIISGVKVDFTGVPNTTTVTITELGGMNQNILTLAAGNTDGVYYPTAPASTQAGADVDAAVVRVPITLSGTAIRVVVALSDAVTNGVVVTVYWVN